MRKVTSRLANFTPFDWIGGASVLVLSFTLTLWLTEPEMPPADKIAWLAASAISDEQNLQAASHKFGLRHSPYIRGHIEALRRSGANVMISGWAIERGSKGEPMTVMAFAGGNSVFYTETNRERPDVASALNLSREAARNAAFSGDITCAPQQKLVVVAVSVTGSYAALETPNCP